MQSQHRRTLATTLSALTLSIASAGAGASPQLGEAPLQDIVNAMTLDEKVSLIKGTGMAGAGNGPQVGATQDKVPGAAGTTVAIPRLGIPSIVLADGPAGVRISPTRDTQPDAHFYATAFPIATLLASSWDVALAEQVGQAMGQEAAAYGIDILLAPALNIHRHALGGRNFEYYSEDPWLSGQMASAVTSGIQAQGVGATLKHFVANNHEWNRDQIDVRVSEQALQEIYLRGFEIAVKEAAPWAVMTSYNKVNGEYTSQSPRLLDDTLRKQWQFSGLVMTDWFAGDNPVSQLKAGNDLLMPGLDYQSGMVKGAVMSGQMDEAQLDTNVTRILDVITRTRTFHGERATDAPDLETHKHLARKAAAQSMVLLKNSGNVLPLAANTQLALLGNAAYHTGIGGTGSGDVHEAYAVDIAQGMSDAGFKLDPALAEKYRAHIKQALQNQPKSNHPLADMMPAPQLPALVIDKARATELAKQSDAGMYVLGRSSGEFIDRPQQDFYLTDDEHTVIKTLSAAFKAADKPFVVVLNVGGVIEMASWQDNADAIVLAFQPGQEAGHALADIITGKVNPSGKLTSTWPNKLADYPADSGFPGTVTDNNATPNGVTGSLPASVTYSEDLHHGYRYFDQHPEQVQYPFGFGLSYTGFTYSGLTLDSKTFDQALKVTVTVTNSGDKPGREVAQLYVSGPNSGQSAKSLQGFAKTRLLAPEESQQLTFTLLPRHLTSYDVKASQWVAPAGEYKVQVSASSVDAGQQAVFDLPSAIAEN